MHIELNAENVPECLRAAIRDCGKHSGSIEVKAAESFESNTAFTGNRSVAVAVNLATGARSTVEMGSWGGSNPFESRPLDRPKPHAIAPGFAVVAGESGGQGTFLKVYVHPGSMAPLLPNTEGAALDIDQQRTLDAHCGLNSRGRREYFERHPVARGLDTVKAELAALGLLKVNRTGAAKVTASGRNARKEMSIY